MGLFNFSKKNKTELTDEQKKWNKMWTLWASGEAESPYAELMTYQNEINNGGHMQFFDNTENLQKVLAALETILPAVLQQNLKNAYNACLALEQNGSDEKAEELLKQCDAAFFENEERINSTLKEYSAGIVL